MAPEIGDRVTDHPQVLFQRGAERIADMLLPGFAENGDDGNLRCEEFGNLGIVLGADAGPAGAAERGQLRMFEFDLLHPLKEGFVLRIRAWPAALDEVHAKLVQPTRYANLIFDT